MSKRKRRRQLLASVIDGQEHRRAAAELVATRNLLQRALELLTLYGCVHKRAGKGVKVLREQVRRHGEEE